MCSQWSSKQRIRLNLQLPISALYLHFSVLSPFQRFIPISAFHPHFSFRFQFPFPRFSFGVLSLPSQFSLRACSQAIYATNPEVQLYQEKVNQTEQNIYQNVTNEPRNNIRAQSVYIRYES
jgi:hypothetical protein